MKTTKVPWLVGASLALLIFVTPVSWARPVAIYNPDPIKAPCNLGADKMKSAIRQALHGRGWTVKEVAPGHIEGRLDKRKHLAVIDIKYTGTQAVIRYKSSENLNYSKEGDSELIHGNYNKWIMNLERDLGVHLSKAC